MNTFGKIVAFIVGGLIFSFLGYMVVALPFSPLYEGSAPGWLFFVFLIAAAFVSFMAPTQGKAWRRLLISSAVFALLLPISTLILSMVGINEAAITGGEHSGAAAAGAAIGGGMVTIFTGFVGFFLAAVFLVIGLLVGRESPARPSA